METLEIQPIRKGAAGAVTLPGSKSITNRALLLASVAKGTSRIEGILRSEDTALMLECLDRLGVVVRDVDGTTVDIVGGGFPNETADLYVGTAGTVARMLVGMLGVQAGGRYRVDGSPVMRKRPMKGLTDLLLQIGCEIDFEGEEGALPFVLRPRGFRNTELLVDATASSQVLSAALLAAPLAGAPVTVRVREGGVRQPYVVMTARMMASFGVSTVSWNDGFTEFVVEAGSGYQLEGSCYAVEADASAASYFLTLPLVTGGTLRVEPFVKDGLQGDAAFADVLSQLGAQMELAGSGVWVRGGRLSRGPHTFDFHPISDTFLTLAALAPLLPAPIRIEGIAHTRKQESDRVHAMATELLKLGQGVEEEEDALHILPNRAELMEVARAGVAVDTYRDHRVAMSFGILGSADLLGGGAPWMTIRDPRCSEKTYPAFFEELTRLSRESWG
jgi:3-phosphoshikimate 1-carboxyvinyltransferase